LDGIGIPVAIASVPLPCKALKRFPFPENFKNPVTLLSEISVSDPEIDKQAVISKTPPQDTLQRKTKTINNILLREKKVWNLERKGSHREEKKGRHGTKKVVT
jgi:hypothetical protein